MQVSNWGQRPLSAQQLSYAALDAWSAVRIFRGMGEEFHPFRTRQGLSHHAFTYDRRHGGVNGVGHHTPARRPPGGGGGGGHNGSNGGHGNGGGQVHNHGNHGNSNSHGGGHSQAHQRDGGGHDGSCASSAGLKGGPQATAAFWHGAAGVRAGWSKVGGHRGLQAPVPQRPMSRHSTAAAQRQLATPRMLLHLLPMRLLRHVTCLL